MTRYRTPAFKLVPPTLFVIATVLSAPPMTVTALADPLASLPRGASAPIVLKEGRLSLDGKSTLHPYTASTATLEVRASVEPAATSARDWVALLKPQTVSLFEVRIPVMSLKSGKDGLDKNMYKALKAEKSPEITFSARGYEAGAPTASGVPIRVRGVLTVAGVDRDIELSLLAREKDGMLSVEGERDLLMTEFGIEPPKFMLGTLKTDNRIVIRFSLVFALASL
jgi:hypothetical protein